MLPAYILLSFVQVAASAALETRAPNCNVYTFNVFASANNYNYSTILPDLNDPQVLSGDLANDVFATIPVSGTQQIVGRYCTPSKQNANSDKLQLLVHGITSNKDYWSGLGFPGYKAPSYSWEAYMSALGYPTLAIDRLGNGASSHPDPITTVQVPYEVNLYHNLVQQIKHGKTQALPKPYPTVIYVGHSLGSEIGDNMLAQYPDDFATVILTGFSKRVLPSLTGISLQLAGPASVHDPSRFGNLSAGYLTSNSFTGRINSFFGTRENIDYEEGIAKLFYSTEDTVSVGQFIGAFTAIATADGYRGRVLVLTGERDQAFCGPGSPVVGVARCGDLLRETGTSLFPNAEYSWHAVPHTGHAVNLHVYRLKAFAVAAEFLAGKSFAG